MARAGRPIEEYELHAYVDGELDDGRAASVAEHLAAHAEDALRTAAWRDQNAALRAVFDPVLDEPVPAAMHRPARPAWSGHIGRAAAALLLVAVGGVGGWWLHARGTPSPDATLQDFAGRAAVAHAVYAPEVRHPVEVGAAERGHLVGWLSKRLGVPLRAPDLKAVGFALVGGRLLPDARSPAAQFMYEDRFGKRVTIYLRVDARDNRETAFLWRQEGDLIVCYWLDGSTGYAVTGRLAWDEIEKIAGLVYDQVD